MSTNDNEKSAYIVQGCGEGTGCRLLTDILLQCGCVGKSGHTQDFQHTIGNQEKFNNWLTTNNIPDKLVIRFSYPHGNYQPELKEYYNTLKIYYNNVYIVITTRSWLCQEVDTIKSAHMTNNPIQSLPTLKDRMTMAYKHIFKSIYEINCQSNNDYTDFIVVNLGDILSNPIATLTHVLGEIDITIPSDFNFDQIRKNEDNLRYIEYIDKNNISYNKTKTGWK